MGSLQPNVPLILLAEDNQADVHLVRAALAEHHVLHRLHVAPDGELAVQFIEQAGVSFTLDLVLLDLNLPRRSGHDVLKYLRHNSACPAVPAIVITSSDSPLDRAAATSLGANAYFRKPSQLEDFLRLGLLVNQTLASSSA
jgi:CheY-like chemotaxis protein